MLTDTRRRWMPSNRNTAQRTIGLRNIRERRRAREIGVIGQKGKQGASVMKNAYWGQFVWPRG